MAAKVKEKEAIDKGMIRVLVYGTLKQDHSNHILLEQADAVFLGYDSVTGPFDLFDLGAIPAVMDSDDVTDTSTIRGELWAMNPEGLAALDLLEGHPHLYQRRKLWTNLSKKRAWMYMLMAENFMPADAQIKPFGLWRASIDENKFWLRQSNRPAIEPVLEAHLPKSCPIL